MATAIPLLIVIVTAIATKKIPELFRVNQGLWYMVSDARTDFNPVLHITSSIYFHRWMPGLYSSPLLLVAAIYLLATSRARM